MGKRLVMKVQVGLSVFLLAVVAGCPKRDDSSQKQGILKESSSSADSSARAAAPVPDLTYEERQGKALYERYCVVCHGEEGKGDGFNAFNLDPRPRDFSDSVYMRALGPQQTIQTISGGGRSVNKSPLMPSYAWTMNKNEIEYVASYLRTFSSHR